MFVTAEALLNAWERGVDRPAVVRSLLLLGAAEPEATPEALAALSVGHRDDRLLALRAALFGPELSAVVDCPACGARVEFTVPVAGLRVDPGPGVELALEVDRYRLRLRPPTSDDLLALTATSDARAAEELLLVRCVTAERDGAVEPVNLLPELVREAAVAALAEADPSADLRFELTCPTCGHRWEPPFDPAAYLWTEVEHWALRALRDVHDLARAYGWREADVLALSPLRRQLYLEMAYG